MINIHSNWNLNCDLNYRSSCAMYFFLGEIFGGSEYACLREKQKANKKQIAFSVFLLTFQAPFSQIAPELLVMADVEFLCFISLCYSHPPFQSSYFT